MSGNSVINTNMKSLIAQDSSNINNRKLSTAMERLSTGNKINSAKDDAAGLAISTRMDSQIRGLNMAVKNAYDTVSLTETAEGAMQEVTNMLQRMRELALQAANDTNSDLDRRYLQDEIDQLAAEIDRVATTTQFNSINVLDGSYAGKVFQIGSNFEQSMNISIGSMASDVLGVATSNSAASSTSSTSSSSAASGTTSTIEGNLVEGTAADKTVVNLDFLNNGQNGTSGSDVYSFTVVDDISGLSASLANATVDLTQQLSKDAFLAKLTLAASTAQTDTRVTSGFDVSAQLTPGATGLDLSSPVNYGKVKFAISVDGGATVQVDLRDKLISTSGVDESSVTNTELIAGMTSELQRLFDTSIQASAHTSNGGIVIEDDQGRRLKVTQGAGDGALFGTDEQTSGGLLARETERNNISAAWEGSKIVLTNEGGGKVSVQGFTSQNSSQVVFDTVKDSQTDGINEPVLLATANANMLTQSSVSFTGKVEQTELNMIFSDRIGDGSALYSFRITNGDGDDYANISNLETINTLDDATIQASVAAAISAGIVANYGSDSTFDASEFEVVFKDNQLSITNTKGRAIAIEDFSSTHGFVTVTPANEPGSSEVLASQNAYYSETRVKLNTGAFGLDFSATGTNRFQFTMDGVRNSANMTISVDGDSAAQNLSNGTQFAASVQAAIRATDVFIRDPNDGSAMMTADISNVTVTYDADTAELVFRDPAGRALGFGYDASANGLQNLTVGPLLEQSVTGNANKRFDVDINSAIAQGDVINASEVKMTFNTSDTSFNFQLNGTYLDGASTNASAAMVNAVAWDTTTPFDEQDIKTKLDDLMVTLNATHPDPVFEYKVDSANRAITLYQRDGGELVVGGFVTANTHRTVTAELTPAADQGDATTLSFLNHSKATQATANGTLGVATTATLNLEGDDLYGLKVSDGIQSYTLSDTVVDISNTTSVSKFADSLEEALIGSGIKVTMDTDGNVFFKRDDGGQIILQEFTSATGKAGRWTPSQGQGEAVALAGNGQVPLSVTVSSSGSSSSYSPVSGGGSTAVSEINIQTQVGASNAIKAIDSALAYVQAERSNLGAVQNRLTHTIDNLSNIVTSTSSAQSRVRDTDYAKETSELARTQIISQAATAMLAQANQQPQLVLQLLQ
ncbi:MAG: hypothetical protein CBC42_05460 [Betaproteobacteria bacterium TMED82]|nr:MAG: hypothetical protein CBC42_05460 [Betaproteobacteria bacterium TMED82]